MFHAPRPYSVHPKVVHDSRWTRDTEGNNPLHLAIKDDKPPILIQHHHLKFVHSSNQSHSYPIHTACAVGSPVSVLQLLIQAWPESLLVADAFGRTPLHVALVSQQQDTALYVLQKCPEATHLRDKDGNLPIHVALDSNHAVVVIQALVEANPESLFEMGEFQMLPLHMAILAQAETTTLSYLIELAPDTATNSYRKSLPMHLAAYQNPRSTLELFAQSVRECDSEGNLPIHCACSNWHGDCFEYLVGLYPESLLIKNAEGNLPLHLAVENSNMAAISCFTRTVPICVTIPGKNGALAIELVEDLESLEAQTIFNNYPGVEHLCRDHLCHILKAMDEQHHERLQECNSDGRLPIHKACMGHHETDQVLEFLVGVFPQGLEMKDKHGRLPLHLVVSSYKPVLQGWPEAVEIPERYNLLPFHLACIHDASIDAIYDILRSYPDALHK